MRDIFPQCRIDKRQAAKLSAFSDRISARKQLSGHHEKPPTAKSSEIFFETEKFEILFVENDNFGLVQKC